MKKINLASLPFHLRRQAEVAAAWLKLYPVAAPKRKKKRVVLTKCTRSGIAAGKKMIRTFLQNDTRFRALEQVLDFPHVIPFFDRLANCAGLDAEIVPALYADNQNDVKGCDIVCLLPRLCRTP